MSINVKTGKHMNIKYKVLVAAATKKNAFDIWNLCMNCNFIYYDAKGIFLLMPN